MGAHKAKDEATPRVLGWDAVGEVVAVGSEVTLYKAGDRVWYAGDISRPGSNSALQLVDERIAAIAPKTLNDPAAAPWDSGPCVGPRSACSRRRTA